MERRIREAVVDGISMEHTIKDGSYEMKAGHFHPEYEIYYMVGIKDFDVTIPVSEAEKEQIGQFFSQLDHIITLHQRELENLKNIKKSMLEKMFV